MKRTVKLHMAAGGERLWLLRLLVAAASHRLAAQDERGALLKHVERVAHQDDAGGRNDGTRHLGGGGGLKGYRVCEGLTVNTWLNGGMCQH